MRLINFNDGKAGAEKLDCSEVTKRNEERRIEVTSDEPKHN